MDFWVLSGLMTVLVAGVLALSAMVRRRGTDRVDNDVIVYRDQLLEVERDQARGVISAQQGERLKLEVSRRILEADRQNQQHIAAPANTRSPLLAVALVLMVFGGAFYLYAQLGAPQSRDLPLSLRLQTAETARLTRPAQAEIEAQVQQVETELANDPAHLELMVKLRTALKTRPDDLQGHQLLARNEAGLGDFIAAHRAQKRVLEIKGDAATDVDFANYADLLALAANGYVSPEAEAAIAKVLTLDPRNGSGRYYLGLMQAQTGRPDLAFNVWQQLLQDSRPDAPWVVPIRAQIGFVAADAGVRYELPPLAVGPSADDIAAAQDMSAQEQAEMIQGMVERLSNRLAEDGGPASDWARLIGALGVLGDTDRAAAIWGEAQQVFASAPDDLAEIRKAASRAGVAD